MQEIWSQVLGLEQGTISLDQDFFQMGGNSLSAMRVASEARQAGLNVSVATIFRYPTLADLAGHSGSLAPTTPPAQITPFSLIGEASGVIQEEISRQYGIKRNHIVDAYPCTPLQEGLLSLTDKGANSRYTVQHIMELSPDIDVGRFRAAWATVVKATPALRTRIVQHPNVGLVQIVVDEPISWTETVTGDLAKFLEADRGRPMGLGQPLTRYALVNSGPDSVGALSRWFALTIHHALHDAWSLALIVKAVERAYDGEHIEAGPPFQRFIQYIRDQDTSAMTKYWKRALDGFESTPFPPPVPASARHDALAKTTTVYHSFPAPPRRGSLGVTATTVIRAAWAVVTGQMSSSDDVVFGVTVTGRSIALDGVDNMTGPTIATVPLRVRLDGAKKTSVNDYLTGLQRQATDMIPHEQAGLSRIGGLSDEARQACQFRTLLVIQQGDVSHTDCRRLGTWLNNAGSFPEFGDLGIALQIRETGQDKLVASATFDPDVIQPWLMSRLLERLEFVIGQLQRSGPKQTLSDIQVSTPLDLEQIWTWNATVPASVEWSVASMIAERAVSSPNAQAVHAWDGQMTYAELMDRATRLANYLLSSKEHTSCPDRVIPICMEKSMWVSVAMLATLLAGRGFVLLDSTVPEERLRSIVEQVGPRLPILCSSSTWELSTRLCDGLAIQVDESSLDMISLPGSSKHLPEPNPDGIAYVAFTSGSTGTPKGAIITQRNLSSAIHHQSERAGITSTSRIFDFAAHSFDMVIWATLFSLANGACVCVPSDKDRLSNLQGSLIETRATLAFLVPSVCRLLTPSQLPDLRTVHLGGEKAHIEDFARWWDHGRSIKNLYGPAECTLASVTNPAPKTPEDAVYVGRGAGSVTWIVDPQNHERLLPPGCIGELVLEGPIVGAGYLGNPQQTAESFITDPTWLVEGIPGRQPGRHGRVYKTGDLVCYAEDGRIDMVGRKDTQIKIRGQRVEVEETEVRLLEACPDEVKRAVVELIVPQGSEEARPMLAAFLHVPPAPAVDVDPLELERQPSLDPSTLSISSLPAEVEDKLTRALPVYMIPTVFFTLPVLPMTSTAKTDRKRLRQLAQPFTVQELASASDKSFLEPRRAPTTATERQLQRIWADVLGVEPSGICLDDSFFKLGGDSIAAMKVSGEAHRVGLTISVPNVFSHRRLHQLAAVATAATA